MVCPCKSYHLLSMKGLILQKAPRGELVYVKTQISHQFLKVYDGRIPKTIPKEEGEGLHSGSNWLLNINI
ncbi:hypothetical protein AB4K20DRAFT_1895398 [Rhizopus microsporus]